jgi:fatty acid synthase
VKALETVFCPKRTETLKIGSVKSNIGHSEPASGLCSVAKVVLGFELGQILPNINLKTLRSDIEAFHNGKIIVMSFLRFGRRLLSAVPKVILFVCLLHRS